MPNRIKSLRLKGQYFDEVEELCLFPDEKNRISILYGKNGSGKSSITRAFSSYSNEELSEDIWNYELVELLDYQDAINLNKNCIIKTFDENFIDKKIRIKKDGLDSIVMFGEQVKIDSEITIKKERLEELKIEESDLKEKKMMCSDENNPNCSEFYLKRISNELKRHGGWAEIDSNIKGLKQKSSVNKRVIEEISASRDLDEDVVLEEFSSSYNQYKNIRTNSDKIDKTIKKIILSEGYEKDLVQMLGKIIKEPKMTEREKRILEEIKRGNQNQIALANKTFEDKMVDTCPYCFRSMNNEEKQKIKECFNTVLNEEVKNHKKELTANKVDNFEIDIDCYSKLDEGYFEQLTIEYKNYIQIRETYLELIEQKINNVYQPIIIDELKLSDSTYKINNILEKLEIKRIEYNDKIDNLEEMKKDLIDLNKNNAYFYIYDDFNLYIEKVKKFDALKNKHFKVENEIKDINQEIDKLESKRSNLKIAIDVINKRLSYIFFDSERIKLIPSKDNYLLKVRGKSVTPEKISCGERNALALCYFFVSLFENLDERDMYSEEVLVIIDDPISSFDFDNKIGILSYLKYEISNIIRGNQSSRIVIMSHDLDTINSIVKIGDDLSKYLSCKNMYVRQMLEDKKIYKFNKREENQYSISIQDIYNFAEGSEEDVSLGIGNKMRRVIEAFATFEYKKSLNELCSDENIINQLKDESYKRYFSNFMYRIVLNEESHTEMSVKGMQNMDFLSKFSKVEMVRTAKGILCFIYLLNPIHIESHINDNKKILIINNWCNDIKRLY